MTSPLPCFLVSLCFGKSLINHKSNNSGHAKEEVERRSSTIVKQNILT